MEEAALGGDQGWTAIIRSPRSVARLSRIQCPYRIADTSRAERLAQALEGFEVVVNASLGDSHKMLMETKAVYEGCQRAGVRLLIHLSSAVVFDRAKMKPGQGEPDRIERHWMLYARAKLASEKYLANCIADTPSPAVVVLRPSLIWGPRSPWSLYPVKALDRGVAWLGCGGNGVCNLIYVDNLNRCIRRVIENGSAISGFYNVRDPDPIRWVDYFTAIASQLGYPMDRIKTVATTKAPWSKATLAEWLKQQLWFYAGSKWVAFKNGR
jgi:nucleoside-diphosphate-sugar epimerase